MLTSPRQGEAPADQTLPELFWMMDHVLCPTLAMHRGIREDDRQLRFESRLELQQTRVATPHPNYRVLAMADEVERATFTEALQRELNAIEVGTRNGQVNPWKGLRESLEHSDSHGSIRATKHGGTLVGVSWCLHKASSTEKQIWR